MGGSLGWGHHQRTSSSRDDYSAGVTPPLRRVESRGSLKDEQYERGDLRERERERERERDVQVQQERERREMRDRERQNSAEASGSRQQDVKHEGEDGMPSTSDFVKKLYKCVACFPSL